MKNNNSEQIIVKFDEVTKQYGDLVVLDKLNLEIKKNEMVSIIGPSGSGKTTVLRVLMTLEKINGGVIHLDGEPLTHMDSNGSLVEANESSVPILAISTDIGIGSRGRYALTELDQLALFRPLTKWNGIIERSEDVPKLVRTAFREMTTGRPGSAHLALPFDVQNGSVAPADIWHG